MRVPALLLAPLAVAMVAAPAAAGAGPWVTEFGRRVLTGTDQIVVARVAAIRPAFRGITTARLAVEERLYGYDPADELLLMYVDASRAPDAFGSTLSRRTVTAGGRRRDGLLRYLDEQRGEAAGESRPERQRDPTGGGRDDNGVRLAAGEEGLFFLRRSEASYALVGFVGRNEPLYEPKHRRLIELLRLEAIPALTTRAKDAKYSFFRELASDDLWVRGHCARELASLASRHPEIFTANEAERIAARLEEETDPGIARELETALSVLDPEVALAWARRAEERERLRLADELARARIGLDALRSPEIRAADVARIGTRYGRAATALVATFLDDDSPLVREAAARTLAGQGGPSARPALREALQSEEEPDVVRALLVAAATTGDPEAAFGIGAHLEDPRHERTAIHALATLHTARALAILRHHRRTCGAEMRALIDTLLRGEDGS